MADLIGWLTEGWHGPLGLEPRDLLLSMACALGCGLVVAEAYRRTHRGLDYSRPFVQVLLLVTVIGAFVTLIVGDDLARAFTLVGALSVVRFRTAVKEARDLAFIFWAVAVGMGAGCRFLSLTVEFTAGVAVVVWLLTRSGYGARDGAVKVLRVCIDSAASWERLLAPPFAQFLADQQRISVGLVRQGLLYEVVYLVRLKPRAQEEELLRAIRAVNGDQPVTLASRDEESAY